MTIDSLIDERFSAINSALSSTTSELQDFLEELSNINRNVDSLSVNVSVNKTEGPTEITDTINMTDPDDISHISVNNKLTPVAPQLPSLSRYLEILAEIRDMAYSPLDSYDPVEMKEIDFDVAQPSLMNEVPIEDQPSGISIEDFTYYTFDELLIPEPILSIPDLDIEQVDFVDTTIDDYIDSDSEALIQSLLSALTTINSLLQAVLEENDLVEVLDKIKNKYLDVSDEWVEQKLATSLETFSFSSYGKRHTMPTPKIADSIKNNGLVSIFGQGRVNVFQKIENEKEKYRTVGYEALIQLRQSMFDSYISLLKYKYSLATSLWELALMKNKAALVRRKALIMVHEAMIATIEEYISSYRVGQEAYQAQVSYDRAFVEEANTRLEKIQNEIALYQNRIAAYKSKVMEIDTQIKAASAKLETYSTKIDEKLAYVKRNQAALASNQNLVESLTSGLDASKASIDGKRLEIGGEAIQYEGDEDVMEYALVGTELSKNNTLLRLKMDKQQQEVTVMKLQSAFDKLAAIEQLYIARTETEKARFVQEANTWAFGEASQGIRSNVRTIREIIDAISRISLTGYEPLAALAGGLANTVDAMVTGVYEALTNL